MLTGFVLLFSIWPLARLFWEGFAPQGAFNPTFILDTLDSKSVYKALWHSLDASFMGMLGALAMGGLTAFIIALTDVRFKLGLVLCFMLPMMIPPQITALSWIQIFGPSSALLNTLGLAPAPGLPQPDLQPGRDHPVAVPATRSPGFFNLPDQFSSRFPGN